MFDLKGFFRVGPDRLADAVPVLRTPLECSQHQHVQSPLHDFNTVLIRLLLSHLLAESLP